MDLARGSDVSLASATLSPQPGPTQYIYHTYIKPSSASQELVSSVQLGVLADALSIFCGYDF